MQNKIILIKYVKNDIREEIKVCKLSEELIISDLIKLGATDIEVLNDRRLKSDAEKYGTKMYNYLYKKYKRGRIHLEEFFNVTTLLKDLQKRNLPFHEIQQQFESSAIYQELAKRTKKQRMP